MVAVSVALCPGNTPAATRAEQRKVSTGQDFAAWAGWRLGSRTLAELFEGAGVELGTVKRTNTCTASHVCRSEHRVVSVATRVLVRGSSTRCEPFNFTQGGQFDFVWLPARTMQPHGARAVCLTKSKNIPT